MALFKKEKTLNELEEADAKADVEIGLAEKRMLIREMEQKYGKGWQNLFKGKHFSSGINWQELKFRLGQGKK